MAGEIECRGAWMPGWAGGDGGRLAGAGRLACGSDDESSKYASNGGWLSFASNGRWIDMMKGCGVRPVEDLPRV
jgi:hypothetical protein